MDVVLELKNRYPSLSEADRRIADTVFGRREDAVRMSVAEFAAAAGVAPSTVIRLCRSLGLEGFPEFKLALSHSSDTERIFPAVEEGENVQDVFRKVFSSGAHALDSTLSMLPPELLERAVALLDGAKHVAFFGIVTSATIAQDACLRFLRIGFSSSCSTDGRIMRIAATALGPGDAAVGISHCGETPDTVAALEIARRRGASTLCITSRSGSAVTGVSDCPIVVYSDEIRYPVMAVSARIAHIAVLDALCVALSLKRDRRNEELNREMENYFRELGMK